MVFIIICLLAPVTFDQLDRCICKRMQSIKKINSPRAHQLLHAGLRQNNFSKIRTIRNISLTHTSRETIRLTI